MPELCNATTLPSAARMVHLPASVLRRALRPRAVRNHSVVVAEVPPLLGRPTSQELIGAPASLVASSTVWVPSVAVRPCSATTRTALPVIEVVFTRMDRLVTVLTLAPG